MSMRIKSTNIEDQGTVHGKPNKHQNRLRRWIDKKLLGRQGSVDSQLITRIGEAADHATTVAAGLGESSGDHNGLTAVRKPVTKKIIVTPYVSKKTYRINALCGFKDFIGATRAKSAGGKTPYVDAFREYYRVMMPEPEGVTDRAVLVTYSRHAIATAAATAPGRFCPEPAIKPYRIKELLGEGSQGVVFKVTKNGKKFVAKLACMSLFVRLTMNEFILMRELKHPNVVRALGPLKSGFLMEYVHTDLSYVLAFCEPNNVLNFRVVAGVVNGVAYLHSRGVAHLDIKPDNILLDTKGHPKLADFGLSARYRTPAGDLIKLRKAMGTIQYMAPELLRFKLGGVPNGMVIPPLDMWACGCIAYEVLSTVRLFGDDDARRSDDVKLVQEKHALMVKNGLKLPRTTPAYILRDDTTELLLTVAQKLLRVLPSERMFAVHVAYTYFSSHYQDINEHLPFQYKLKNK